MRPRQTRRAAGLVAFAIALLSVGGCLAGHPRLTASDAPVFWPEVFFDGPSHGTGTLRIRGRGSRPVHVVSQGQRQPDGRFRLEQTITIGDDAPHTRTWTMQRDADGHVAATLTDARGPVHVTVRGAELRIRYRMGAVTTMSQRLVLRPGGQSALSQRPTVVNLATVRMLGVPVARLEEVIRRGQPSQ